MQATLILLGVLFWMVWFTWFPEGDRLLRMLPHHAAVPVDSGEIWAMQLYRETFAPDCGAQWIRPGVLWASVVCLLSFFALSVCITLFSAGLLPTDYASWIALVLLLFVALGQMVLLLLLIMEMVLLFGKGIPLSCRARRDRWLADHPAPEQMARQNNEKQPWWFWLDSSLPDMLIQMLVFLGAFVTTVLVGLFGFHLAAPAHFTAGRFWSLVFCWSMVFLWLPVSITTWLMYLDWTHREREVLMSWAEKQAKIHSAS